MLGIVLQELGVRGEDGFQEMIEEDLLLGHLLLGMLGDPQLFPFRLLADSPQNRRDVPGTSGLLVHSVPQAAYSFSISSPNRWLTTRRLSFMVGVSSPSSIESSRGRMTNFLIVS